MLEYHLLIILLVLGIGMFAYTLKTRSTGSLLVTTAILIFCALFLVALFLASRVYAVL